jgi:hypothetical protein
MKAKLLIILAAMLTMTACNALESIEPVEVNPIEIEVSETMPAPEPEPAPEIEYTPSPEYKPMTYASTQTQIPAPEPEPEPETESKPTAMVAMFEDNNQVVVEVVYEDNIYIGDVYEQLFQQNITEGTEIPVYTLQGTFIPIDGFEGETWYEFQGDAVWTLDESYLGFIPSESEEYTLFFSSNWTTETSEDDFFICVQDY